VDTIIFLSILVTLLAMRAGKRSLSLGLFLVSLIATLLLFNLHVTSSLKQNF